MLKNSSKKKKILIIRFSSIGDIVLTTPVIRCVHEQTNTTIHYLTKFAFRALLSANPYIEKVFSFKKQLTEIIPLLRKENYDLIIDLHKNIRSQQVRLALRKPSHAFHKLNVAKWLMVNFKINQLPTLHIVDRYMETVKSLGVLNDGNGLDFFIPKEEAFNPSALKIKFPALKFSNSPFISIVIGAAHFTKQIPTEKIVSLAKQIKKRENAAAIFLIGGPADQKKGAEIESAVGKNIINTCGQLSINQSASIIQLSEWVISSDTGMMHIAAALGKNIISIWGNTIPEFGMYPYLKNNSQQHHLFQISGLPCRPCSKIGYKDCPKGHFRCMMDQDISAITKLISEND